MPMAIPPAPEPIRPEQLRVECQACGGSGRTVRIEVVKSPLLSEPVKQAHYAGPCALCDGSGSRLPRKLDL